MFDIVIPVGPHDAQKIKIQIGYTKKNIIGYRNIYIIPYDPELQIEGCITIPETDFPFSIETVEKYHGKTERAGWYLQQLFKLYAGCTIEGILDKYLVIDADTFFLKPTKFEEGNGKISFYCTGRTQHKEYFDHMKRMSEYFDMAKPISGIVHHMMFDKNYIQEIFDNIVPSESNPEGTFYDSFLENITDVEGAGASEYEIYFHYMFNYHSDIVKIRNLNWGNVKNLKGNFSNVDFVSWHWHGTV